MVKTEFFAHFLKPSFSMNSTKELNEPVLAIIALGSNLGDRGELIQRGFDFLSQSFAEPGSFRASKIWETEPVDCLVGSPLFLNAVAVFETRVSLRLLFERCQLFERELGRAAVREVNSPRPLDLDLILFGSMVISTPDLILPHPRAAMRGFVLGPLSELLPELLLPGEKKSVKVLFDELQN